MATKLLIFIFLFCIFVFLGISLFPLFFETPKYSVEVKENKFEIRNYKEMLVIETIQTGSRELSLRKGFSELARYIGGSSKEKKKVKMTVPVMQQKSNQDMSWATIFYMPKNYSTTNAPNPLNKEVVIKKIRKKSFGVIKFNGNPDNQLLENKAVELENWLKTLELNYDKSNKRFAFYHGPMVPGLLRKNEVLIPIDN